jgi:N-acetylglucosaminylphosphatidylinositol deacetylase
MLPLSRPTPRKRHDYDCCQHTAEKSRGSKLASLYPRICRHRSRLVRLALLFFVVLPLVVHTLLAYVWPTRPIFFSPSLARARNILVTVAHPDDECLFFSPAVLALGQRIDRGSSISILVLSSGNHYGLGEQRRTELQGSCAQLGVPAERCVALNVA